MFKKLKWGAVALASALLAGSLGLAAPALADDVPTGTTVNSYLTKVIDGPEDTDATSDIYTFHFDGDGVVTKDEDSGKLMADGVEQNTTGKDANADNYPDTVKEGDVVPAIADLHLKGKKLDSNHALKNDTVSQSTSRASFSYILGEDGATCADSNDGNRTRITFPHAGVWTYRVTETSATRGVSDGTSITRSRASYLLRVFVKNITNADGTETTVVDGVTIEQETTDEGTEIPEAQREKTDPTYPKVDDTTGKITKESPTQTEGTRTTPAGDQRGREVYGFTFANEYVKGNTLVVEKSVEGDYGDKANKLYKVTLTIHDAAAPAGSCITYQVDKGEDTTEGKKTLDGVQSNNSDMVEFKGDGSPIVITANLQHGGTITVTGLYGFLHNGSRTKLTDGLKATTKYDIAEAALTDYTPSVYIHKTNAPGTTAEAKKATTETYTSAKGSALKTSGEVGNDGGYVYLVNTFDDVTVTPTGILINNLPYVLMVGIPVAVGVAMFVNKRRQAELD